MKNRKGFVLYVVIAILLGLAILVFALNDFKRGAVNQLSVNVDQNRLIQICKSANAEILANIRIQANKKGAVFDIFRKIFREEQWLNQPISLLKYSPVLTKDLIEETGGYDDIEVECWSTVTSYSEAGPAAIMAYNAYLDIYSKAYRKKSPDDFIEVRERHDVRLVDLRHYFDKYVLFVKNYSDDLNNPHRRIVIQGIKPQDARISRVYLGNYLFPQIAGENNADNKRIWLDLCYKDYTNGTLDNYKDNNFIGIKPIFGNGSFDKFTHGNKVETYKEKNVYKKHRVSFKEYNSSDSMEKFYQVPAIKKEYEAFIYQAARGAQKKGNQNEVKEFIKKLTGESIDICNTLKSECESAKNSTNSNSAAYVICDDFLKNCSTTTNENNVTIPDYSKCTYFQTFMNSCKNKWEYEYGYLDADSIWDFDDGNYKKGNTSPSKNWTRTLPYKGLVGKNFNSDKVGAYFNEYLHKEGKLNNKTRTHVGRMLKLYGEKGDTPVLVEGPVYLRFFKIGFFDEFSDQLHFMDNKTHDMNLEPVPILFRRKDREPTFQNDKLSKSLPPNSNFYKDDVFMSQAIDTIPINALILDQNIKYYDGKMNVKTLSFEDVYKNPSPFLKPASSGDFEAYLFRREIALNNDVSYSYPSPTKFLDERLDKKENILSIDGIMYIEQGDMDLSSITGFKGKGLVYLKKGNITFGNFRKKDNNDSIRFYLKEGDYILSQGCKEITIEASLAALSSVNVGSSPNEQGTIIFSNQNKVHIKGNLIVDTLHTEKGSNTLDKNGEICIEHDPLIMEPAVQFELSSGNLDAYQVSIGKVKTVFAINTDGKNK